MANTFVVSVLLIGILLAPSVNAFEKGENRISNGGFETGNVGEVPDEWELNREG